MISSVRVCAGVKGRPTPWYTTNNNECINKVFKNEVSTKLSIPRCVEKMEEFLKSQFCQVELAITGEGLYRFREHCRDLEVTKEEWLKKSKDEKQKHVAKVFGCPVRPVPIIQNDAPNHRSQHEEFSENTNLPTPNRETKTISISHSDSGLSVVIPPHSLLTMWKKAEKILNSEADICNAVGKFHGDDHARQVASESNPRLPQFVYQHNTGKVVCDDCPLYKAFKICQHSIAVAELRGSLLQFLRWRKSLSKGRNSAETLTKSLLPMATAGKKKNARKRLPKKQVSSATTTNFIDPLDHELAMADEPLSSPGTMAQMSNSINESTNPEDQILSSTSLGNFQPQVMLVYIYTCSIMKIIQGCPKKVGLRDLSCTIFILACIVNN